VVARSETLVGGLDGCRSGWVLATMPARGGVRGDGPDIRVVPCLDEVVAAHESGRLAAVAIDIPIGLPAVGPRNCDLEARRLLGPRRSSVFPAPVRLALGARTYAEACRVSREVNGKGLSKQLYNILGKIREVDALQSAGLQQRLFEACPELSFAVMSRDVPMRHSKRTAEGRAERVSALRRSGFGDVTPIVDAPPAGATRDDVLDALALAWTARRYVAGSARRLGGETDESGLRMEVIT
jgi:predicted RNase H-like nuclease